MNSKIEENAKALSGNEKETNDTQELILKQLKKQSLLATIIATVSGGIFIVVLGTVLVLVPRVNEVLASANETITAANETIENVNSMSDSLTDSLDGFKNASDNANDLIVKNSENITEAIEKINQIDFDTLNESIQELHDTVEPLQKLVNVFGALTGK